MKIRYSILWFEDDDMSFIIRRIEDYLRELGFEPFFDQRYNLEKVDDIEFQVYDLILLDYHLDDAQTTAYILDKIQEMDYYSEIIFYSGKEKLEELIKNDIKKFEGVFWLEYSRSVYGSGESPG